MYKKTRYLTYGQLIFDEDVNLIQQTNDSLFVFQLMMVEQWDISRFLKKNLNPNFTVYIQPEMDHRLKHKTERYKMFRIK